MSSSSYRAVKISPAEKIRLAAEQKRRREAEEKRRREEQKLRRMAQYDQKFAAIEKMGKSSLDLDKVWNKLKASRPVHPPVASRKNLSPKDITDPGKSLAREIDALKNLLKDLPAEIESMIPSRVAALRKTLKIVTGKRPGRQQVHTVSIELKRRELEDLIKHPKQLLDTWEAERQVLDRMIVGLETASGPELSPADRQQCEELLTRLNTLAALQDIDRMQTGIKELDISVNSFITRLEKKQSRAIEREYVDRSVEEVLVQMGYTPCKDAGTEGAAQGNEKYFFTPRDQAIRLELDEFGRLATEFFVVRRNSKQPPDQEALSHCLSCCEDLEELERRLASKKGIQLTLEGEITAEHGGYPVLDLESSDPDMEAIRRKKKIDREIWNNLAFDVDTEEYFEPES